MKKTNELDVRGKLVRVIKIGGKDYVCLTDMAKLKSEDAQQTISNWMRNRMTLAHLGLWEELYNPDFSPLGFEGFRKEVGINHFTMENITAVMINENAPQKRLASRRVAAQRAWRASARALRSGRLDIITTHRSRALMSVNVESLLTYWEIGAFLSPRIHSGSWSTAVVGRLADYIKRNKPELRGYGKSNLYNMARVYDLFSDEPFLSLTYRYQKQLPAPDNFFQLQNGKSNRGNENPSIGIILCRDANRIVVEYAMSRAMSPVMVAQYKRLLIPKDVLQRTFEEYLELPSSTEPEKDE